MPERAVGWPRLVAFLLGGPAAFLLAFLLGACESLFLDSERDAVTVRIESPDMGSAEVVTSRFFLRISDPDCPSCPASIQLVQADTVAPALPFQQTWELTSRQQFFVETYPALQDTATLSLRVVIDGRTWFDDSRTLAPAGPDGGAETLRFVYQFREPTL